MAREPRHQVRDGVPVSYLPYVSPPRSRSYAGWGAWAAPGLAAALWRLRRAFAFDLVHAHNAVPAGGALPPPPRPGPPPAPPGVSLPGGGGLFTAPPHPPGRGAGRA